MSFRAVTESVVHFESFRNIDLFHQGIYFIRTSLYYSKESNFYYAQPYTIFNAKMTMGNQVGVPQTQKRKKRNLDHHNIIPANIDKNLFTFNTRAFMIRYCEEEVELNDIGHFRVELDIEDSQPSQIEFYMEVELMFSDLINQGGPEKFQQSNNLKDIEGNVEFKCVSVQKFKIKNLIDGIFEYTPVVFDEQHFCVALCTIHSSLLDFRFRSRPLKSFSRAEYQKNLQIQESNKVKEQEDKNKKGTQQSSIEEWRPSNIAEYLFSNDRGEIADDIDSQEIDMIYNGYMQALVTSYDKLKGKFNSFAAKCLSERQKRESGLILVAPPLVMPQERDLNDNDNTNGNSNNSNKEEEKDGKDGKDGNQRKVIQQTEQVRMGGRLGGRMEKVARKEEDCGIAMFNSIGNGIERNNVQANGEQESVIADDDEPIGEDEIAIMKNNSPQKMIEREPEREPDNLGNMSHSMIGDEKVIGNQKMIQQSNITFKKNENGQVMSKEDLDNTNYNISHEQSLHISGPNNQMKNKQENNLQYKNNTNNTNNTNNDKFQSKLQNQIDTVQNKQQILLNQLSFSQRIQSSDPYQISFQLVQDINLVSSQVFQLWHKIIEIITINPKFVCEFLRTQYEEKMRENWGEHIYRTIIETKDFAYPSEENVGEIHKQIAQKRRNGPNGTLTSTHTDTFNIIEIGSQSQSNGSGQSINQSDMQKIAQKAQKDENSQALQKALNDLQPILFEECYVKSLEKIKQMQIEQSQIPFNEYNYKGVHLFVMVHGFQGNSCDMRLLKNNIVLLFPEAMFLCSSANEDYTEGDILEMGVRLSQEVNSYINQYCPGSSLGKISFIAHSLGGLIVRASLPYLEEHADKMYNYFTLSSPHLGYMYNQSKIIDAGMWLLKTWRKSQCLQQLRMSDNKNLEDTFLYKLSEMKGLNWFKHIILVSSYQDSYAPFDSARLQICNKAENDSNKGEIYIKMARNILSNLPIDVLYRIDVDFRISEKNLDSLIGRTAHIQFLECQNVMKMLIYRFKEFFC